MIAKLESHSLFINSKLSQTEWTKAREHLLACCLSSLIHLTMTGGCLPCLFSYFRIIAYTLSPFYVMHTFENSCIELLYIFYQLCLFNFLFIHFLFCSFHRLSLEICVLMQELCVLWYPVWICAARVSIHPILFYFIFYFLVLSYKPASMHTIYHVCKICHMTIVKCHVYFIQSHLSIHLYSWSAT